MPLFLITGLPGSGKSTACAELKNRGIEAYDGDEDKLAKWYDNKTGLPIEDESRVRNPEFLRTHSRDIARSVVEDLARQAKDKTIFLCADPENEAALRDLFTHVFALVVDEQTLRHRLATRTNNTWGKLPHEIAYSLALRDEWFASYKKFHYDVIDATQPTRDIVDHILEKTMALR
jgi:dephospho-CoA kinase